VTGTPGVDTPEAVNAIFSGLDTIHLLTDEFVRLELPGGDRLTIVGIPNRGGRDQRVFADLAAQIAPDENTLLLYHNPDLALLAAESGKIDLYLAGHTHGGQVRLPLLPPLFLPRFSGRFVAGPYRVGQYNTPLYVNRGIGTSLLPVRMLCRPEITLIELTP
jgi:hypothetical protein